MATSAEEPLSEYGFFNLNLRFLSDVDAEQISYMKGEQQVELNSVPECIKPVVMNMEALLTFVQPGLQRHGIFMMEKVLEKYPNNLNALANIIEMKKATDLESSHHEICIKGPIEKREKAQSLLEIGYVLLSDMHTEVRKTTDEILTDALKRMAFREKEFVSRTKREAFDRTMKSLNSAVDDIKNLLPEVCTSQTKDEQEEAVKYFESGLEVLTNIASNQHDIAEIAVWKHQLARAHSRIGTSSREISKTCDKKQHMIRAIELFLESATKLSQITDIPDSLKVCEARSYAYVGHLIATRAKEIKGSKDPVPSCISSVEFDLWKNPMQAFNHALKIFKHDRVVHNRYGLTLKDSRSPTGTKKEHKEKDYDLATGCFKKSLEIESNYNWFAYSLLLKSYLDKYKFQCQRYMGEKDGEGQEPDVKCLDQAIKFGEDCLRQRITSDTLLNITEAFYLKGVYPRKGKDGLDSVRDINSIKSALEYAGRGLDHHECGNSHGRIYQLMARCLFLKGDKKIGIEKMQEAWRRERHNITEPSVFREFMIMVFKSYREMKDDKSNDGNIRQRRQALKRACLFLLLGKQKYQKRSKHPLIGVINLYPHEAIEMLTEMLTYKHRNKDNRDLIEECFKALSNHKAAEVRKRAEKLSSQQDQQEGQEMTEELNTDQKYDYCVCHCKEDRMWVDVCLDDKSQRNRVYCTEVATMKKILQNTEKFVFIFSNNFHPKNNDACCAILSLVRVTYPMSNRIIPVLKDDVQIPKLLEDTQPLTFEFPGRTFNEALFAALSQPINDRILEPSSDSLAEQNTQTCIEIDNTDLGISEEVTKEKKRKTEEDEDGITDTLSKMDTVENEDVVTGVKLNEETKRQTSPLQGPKEEMESMDSGFESSHR